jgi:LPXTG-motif cell wall-anchored protein
MKKYVENFFGEETGIETLEMIAFIALGAALLSVILVLYLRFKKSADNVKQATDSVMTQIEQYTKLEKR